METKKLSEQEIWQLRDETAGTVGKIHFNNAGASLQPDVVVEAVVKYLQEEALNGGYETEYKYRSQLDDTHGLIAKLINAEPDEVAIVENASVAWGVAFGGINFKKGDVVITSEYEYATNFLGLFNAQKIYGIEIKLIPNDEHGNFSLSSLEEAISPQTKLIAVTHIPSTGGGMIPIVEIGKIARKHNVLYLVDACQSVGQAPVDVKEIDCDMLAVTGRKYLRAPRGTGFLYVRKKVQDQLKLILMDAHTATWISSNDYEIRKDGRRFELYEKNHSLTLGLAKAIKYALNIGVDRIWERIQYLSNLMRGELTNIPQITVHDMGDQKCGIVTFSVTGIETTFLKKKLGEKNINVSVGTPKATPFYMYKNNIPDIIRASVHYYNTEEEIKILCYELAIIIRSNK